MNRYAGERTAAAAVVIAFCVPLFIGLHNWDIKSDEAIYSYAIDRMLETGDWLTPRTLRFETPFLEKPPLKLWLVAGAMRLGLLPHDEFGFRFLDALFGAFAFVYVFRFGLRLGSPICGLVAVLVLFTFFSFVFNHGLRSNNMDAALVLAYCGGLFHFARWIDSGERRRWVDVAATVGYFTLGFLAKFVAVAFLPLICVLSLFWRTDSERLVPLRGRVWVTPLVGAVLLITPWFAYHAAQSDRLWQTMWQEQVYTRFTGVLDPRQVLPWHYYFSQVWREAVAAGSQWIVILGLATLVVNAWRGGSWIARLLLLWLIVPFALLSLSASKYVHYTYPFLPPLALGAGAAAEVLVRVTRRMVARVMAVLPRRPERLERISLRLPNPVRSGLVIAAAVALALSAWTAWDGRVRLEIAGVTLLRNSSVLRPLVVAAVLIAISGRAVASHAIAIAALTLVLPLSGYADTLRRLSNLDRPMRSLRDCAVMLPAARPETHAYLSSYYELLDHTPYYYLRQLGPWIEHESPMSNNELDLRLYEARQPTLVIMKTNEYLTIGRQLVERELPTPRGLVLSDNFVLATLGPLEPCFDAAVAGGGIAAYDWRATQSNR